MCKWDEWVNMNNYIYWYRRFEVVDRKIRQSTSASWLLERFHKKEISTIWTWHINRSYNITYYTHTFILVVVGLNIHFFRLIFDFIKVTKDYLYCNRSHFDINSYTSLSNARLLQLHDHLGYLSCIPYLSILD